MNDRMMGRIRLTAQSIRDNTQETAEIMSILKFIPVHTEMLFITDDIICTGISPMFRKLEVGEIVPEYTLSIGIDEKGKIKEVNVIEEKK